MNIITIISFLASLDPPTSSAALISTIRSGNKPFWMYHQQAFAPNLRSFSERKHSSIVICKNHYESNTHVPRYQVRLRNPLWSTTSRNNRDAETHDPISWDDEKNYRNGSNGGKYNVIYEKVLRAPRNSATSQTSAISHTFLIDLITYLQCVFELPDSLPVPYETAVPDEERNDDNEDNEYTDASGQNSEDRAVLIIDSPLSNGPCDARLEIEVIGIFPETEPGRKAIHAGPTMAMVALKKVNSNVNSGAGDAKGLFDASEKRIIQSLDRGLQDFEEGRVTMPSSLTVTDRLSDWASSTDVDDGIDAALKRIGYENAINASVSKQNLEKPDLQQKHKTTRPKSPVNIERDGMGNVIIDAASKSVLSSSPKKKKRQQTINSMDKKPASKETSPPLTKSEKSPVIVSHTLRNQSKSYEATASSVKKIQSNQGSEDYAIQMARKQAEALMTTVRAGNVTSADDGTIAISGGEGDFAIMAAQRAAQSRKNTKEAALVDIRNRPISSKGKKRKNSAVPNTDVKGNDKRDRSNDETFIRLQKMAKRAKRQSWSTTISKATKGETAFGLSGSKAVSFHGANKSSRSLKPASKDSAFSSTPRNSVNHESSTTASVTPHTLADKSTDKTNTATHKKSDDEIRHDISQVAKQNEGIRQDLLKFSSNDMPFEAGDEEELSPEELLERVLKFGEEKDKEKKPGVGFVEGAFGKAKDLIRGESYELEMQRLDNGPAKREEYKDAPSKYVEEEELKQIFAAGQAMAEDKLSKPSSSESFSSMMKSSITEEDINELIDAEYTVPRNSRILDEELAEMEVRMSKSQGQDSGPNKTFDVFSGPEVYNPNVDPETAVNWPGARSGTRTHVRLAAELSTALKNAKFAASILSQMREETNDEENATVRYFVGEKELSLERVKLLRACVNEAVDAGIIDDPTIVMGERSTLNILIEELLTQPEERMEEIAMNYKDLLLSDNLVDLLKERLHSMAYRDLVARREGREDELKEIHAHEREIMMGLAHTAQILVKEAQALGAELEVSMLEIIRNICEVAMDPSHKTEEDTAFALTDAVRDMRPLLDDAFVAYLKFAIAEEEGKLARSGLLDDPDHNRWLFVLKIVQEGVYHELARGVKRYVDHIWYVLRMKSHSERKALLKQLIDAMPTMDVRPFVKVVNNIVTSLGSTVKGDFSDGIVLGDMTNKLLQLQRDVRELLPSDRINEMSKDADLWAATQRQRLLERQKLTRQRLEAAKKTGGIDPDQVIKKPGGEFERFS